MCESRDFCHNEEMTDEADRTEKRIFTDEAEIGISPGLFRGRAGASGGGCVEERSCESETTGLHSIGEDSQVTHADESFGHDMA